MVLYTHPNVTSLGPLICPPQASGSKLLGYLDGKLKQRSRMVNNEKALAFLRQILPIIALK